MEKRARRPRLGQTIMAERIGAARARLFVGREVEHAMFDRFIDPDSSRALWFIVGAGGVGKSALLQDLYRCALEQQLDAVCVDAGIVPPNPPAAQHALARASGEDAFETFCLTRKRPILFLDTFECWQALESWFYQEYLPGLSGSLKIVVCTRAPPCLEWRTDEGWRSLMQISHLAPLDDRASTEYLCRRGLAAQQQAGMVHFARGIRWRWPWARIQFWPARQCRASKPIADCSRPSPRASPARRRAPISIGRCRPVQWCAPSTNPCAAMLELEHAGAQYAWLQKLAFMGAAEHGIAPHDLVREILMRGMPQRYPERYEMLAQGAFGWTVNMIERGGSLSWPKAAQLAAEAMYALRALPVVQHFFQPLGAYALYTDRARPEDQSALAAMVLMHEGPDSLAWFYFWQQRCPDGLYVVRDAHASPRGMFFKLDMEALAAADRDCDPFTREFWRALSEEFNLQPGEHAPFIRFWMSAEHAQARCAADGEQYP